MPLQNSDFYKDGAFDQEKAKQAYLGMFERLGYPVSPVLKTDEMWVTDFAQGDFVNVGMAGIFWVNNTDAGYLGVEMFLLPGQMIPEHGHDDCEQAPSKMESWHVRHGSLVTFGEGEDNGPPPCIVPQSQVDAGGVTVRHWTELKPGEVQTLNRQKALHFMVAGPEGAIATEYGSGHHGEAMFFTDDSIEF